MDLIQLNTSYYLGQSYHMGRNRYHTQDMINILNAVHCRYCWPSKTFYTCLSILLATFNWHVCLNTCFSRTTCSLSRYNDKGELDCFNCKTGVFLRLFTSVFTKETNYNPCFCEKKSTRPWGIFNNYKQKLSVTRVHTASLSLKQQHHNALIQLNIGEHCKVYPSDFLSIQDQTGIVSKHNTEIVNHLQIQGVPKNSLESGAHKTPIQDTFARFAQSLSKSNGNSLRIFVTFKLTCFYYNSRFI